MFSINRKKRNFFILIDPDKFRKTEFLQFLEVCSEKSFPSAFLVGGSTLSNTNTLHNTIAQMKSRTSVPLLLFPGSYFQIDNQADGILFLSLLSGRNPEYLIGQHVVAAPLLHETRLDIIPTGYLLIESGSLNSAIYMSHSLPIPRSKPNIACHTALAGQMLGFRWIYLDVGSGSIHPVPIQMVREVRKTINIPLIVGGGIQSFDQVKDNFDAGADAVVIGTLFEKDPIRLAAFLQENNF